MNLQDEWQKFFTYPNVKIGQMLNLILRNLDLGEEGSYTIGNLLKLAFVGQ